MASLLKFQSGVIVSQQAIISAAVVNAANELNFQVSMLVTSGNDKVHRPDSLHYRDRALDFRTKHLTETEKDRLVAEVRRRLGRHYDVVLEGRNTSNEHLHVEHDPKP